MKLSNAFKAPIGIATILHWRRSRLCATTTMGALSLSPRCYNKYLQFAQSEIAQVQLIAPAEKRPKFNLMYLVIIFGSLQKIQQDTNLGLSSKKYGREQDYIYTMNGLFFTTS